MTHPSEQQTSRPPVDDASFVPPAFPLNGRRPVATRGSRETHLRSVAKGISWRVLATCVTAILVYIFTGQFALAITVGSLEFVAKIALFWVHERLWGRIKLGKKEPEPVVLWFTGLSGAGKTTLAKHVHERLTARGLPVEFLDGDTIRDIFPQTGFSRPERDEHVRRVGYLASRLERNGVFVIASFISPYADSRRFVRSLCRNFVEVHVATPLEECERRDVKGLYARARRGEIRNFTGIDDPYEPPASPEIRIDTREIPLDQAGARVIEHIRRYL